jgi:uridine monophosphate synthetase
MSFYNKLNGAIAHNNSLLILALEPNHEMMPNEYKKGQNLIENLRKWLENTIKETRDLVCAYKPTLGFYYALGAEGITLLEYILSLIPANIPIILDAKHSDLNSNTTFAKTIFKKWQIDAVTLNPYSGQDQIAPYLLYSDKAVFILCHTSNPAAINIQEYPTPENPFYLHLIAEAKTWGSLEQLGLEIGSTAPEVFQKVREIAPERLILARSIWSESNNIDAIIKAGLDKYGEGLLVPIPLDYLQKQNIKEEIESLKNRVNKIRNSVKSDNSSCEIWQSNLKASPQHPHQELILQLYDIGCLLFGEYLQASGATFSYYIDLRKIISNPHVFHQVLKAYANILEQLKFDRIAGIPYGSLPTATGLSLILNKPMIYPRKEVKAHGTRKLIEGNFQEGEKVVVVDDILITGKSVIEGVEKLKISGLQVEDIVVFIDHEGGVKERVKTKGYNAYSVLTITEITNSLYNAGKINQEQYSTLIENNN